MSEDVDVEDTHQEWRHDLVCMVQRATRCIHLRDLLRSPTQQLIQIPQLEFVSELGEQREIRDAKGRCGRPEEPRVWRDGGRSQRREAARRSTSNGNALTIYEGIWSSCEQPRGILTVLDVYNTPVIRKAGSQTG